MGRPAVYLAGHIAGLTYGEATDWREEATEAITALGYDVYSPMRGKEHLKETYESRVLEPTSDVDAGVGPFARDMHDLRRSDIVLANMLALDTPSIGTTMELMAGHLLNKFVIVVLPKDARRPFRDARGWHPFLGGTANAIVNSLGEAYAVLEVLKPVQPAQLNFGAVDMTALGDSWGGWPDDVAVEEETDDAISS